MNEICIFFKKGWDLAAVILNNFCEDFGSAVSSCTTCLKYGVHRHIVFFVNFGKAIEPCCRHLEP